MGYTKLLLLSVTPLSNLILEESVNTDPISGP